MAFPTTMEAKQYAGMSRSDAAEYRMNWLKKEYTKFQESRVYTKAWKRVDTTKGNSIDFVRSGHKQEARVECLQAHNTLTTESSSKNNQDSSRCDGFPHTRRVLSNLVHRLSDLLILGRVVSCGFL